MSSASISTRDENNFIASKYSADATSTSKPAAAKYRTAFGSGPGRKPFTASFNQSGSSPSRSALLLPLAGQSRWARIPHLGRAWPAAHQNTMRSRHHRLEISQHAVRFYRVQKQVLRTADGCHRLKAGRESHPTQSAGSDEDPPGAERRRRLLQSGWVHTPQRRHKPPLRGVPARLARPGRQSPAVTPSEVFRQCGEGSIHLGRTRRPGLTTETLGCDRSIGASKIV